MSLFRLLSVAHPDAVAELSHQYRMNEDIMLLSNHLIYEGRLKCGSEEVAKRALVLPSKKSCTAMMGTSSCEDGCWLQAMMEEK